MPHKFAILHVDEDQTTAVASLDADIALEFTPHVDISLGNCAKEDVIEVLQLLDVVFTIVEQVIIAAPRQVYLIH